MLIYNLNMKGKMTQEQKNKLSKALKKYFRTHSVWNKGTRKPKEYYDELRKNRRKNQEYYKKELYDNAVRSHKNKYYNEKRLAELLEYSKQVKEKAGYYGKQNWQESELKYITDNYKDTTIIDMALYLKRSYMSIVRKMSRLKLKKYNKYEIS